MIPIGLTLNTGKANAITLLMMTSVSSAIVLGKSLFYQLVRDVLSVVDEAKHGLRLDVKSLLLPGQYSSVKNNAHLIKEATIRTKLGDPHDCRAFAGALVESKTL
jgi:hypothetical protein